MNDHIEARLKKLANDAGTNGSAIISRAQGQSDDDFQADVARLRRYDGRGLLNILDERTEQYSGQKNVVAVTVELTEPGVAQWRD